MWHVSALMHPVGRGGGASARVVRPVTLSPPSPLTPTCTSRSAPLHVLLPRVWGRGPAARRPAAQLQVGARERGKGRWAFAGGKHIDTRGEAERDDRPSGERDGQRLHHSTRIMLFPRLPLHPTPLRPLPKPLTSCNPTVPPPACPSPGTGRQQRRRQMPRPRPERKTPCLKTGLGLAWRASRELTEARAQQK